MTGGRLLTLASCVERASTVLGCQIPTNGVIYGGLGSCHEPA